MKRKSIVALGVLLLGLVFIPNAGFAKVTELKVNTEKSQIEWLGKKVTGEHSGTIEISKGLLVLNDEEITAGNFVVDMTSLADTDLKDPDYKAKLEGHLKSDDFFGVENFPEAKFVITETKKLEQGNYLVKGDITIKEITQPLEFTVSLHMQDGGAHVSGKIIIDRTKFNVRYGSGSFFENLGDKTINDNFELSLNLYLE